MAFIGNSVQNQGFAPAVDYFNGDGTTVTFTLSRPVASVAQLTAVIENVIQNPATAFTVSGNQITFTSAPPAGTNNVWAEYTSLITQYNGISQDPSVVGDITASGGYLATGDFGNSYIDGTIVDYVTGNARITTGPIDDMTFYHGGTASRSEMLRLSYAGNSTLAGSLAATGTLSDSLGNVRSLPINSQTSAYIVAASDNGKVISITTGGVTVNNSVMSAGMVVTIYNNSGSSQTITQGSGVTLQWAGQSSSTTGNRTLGLYGMATILFLSASSAVITGSGLT